MTTKPKTARRARMTGSMVVWRQSARYQGVAASSVVCSASPAINIGGGFEQRYALRPEGALGLDRRQIQI